MCLGECVCVCVCVCVREREGERNLASDVADGVLADGHKQLRLLSGVGLRVQGSCFRV